MKTTMEELRRMVDVNTVIGDPVMLGGDTVIVPVSRVCLGFVSGGGELKATPSPAKENEEEKLPFAGASVAGMNLVPMAFLTISNHCVRVLPAHYHTTLDRIIEMLPDAFCHLERVVKEACSKHKEQSACEPKPGDSDYTLK